MSSAENQAVFLSYASQDAAAVARIAAALRASGVEVWFDQNELVGGDAWDAKIRGQIASCALFVPVISAATQARLEGYFRIEWKLAAQRTHAMADEKAFLLPVVIDGTRDAEAKVPAEFKAVQWTSLRQGPGGQAAEEALAKFGARVKRLLDGAAGGTSERTNQQRELVPTRAETRRPAGLKLGLAGLGLALAVGAGWYMFRPVIPAPAGSRAMAAGQVERLGVELRPGSWTRADFDTLVPKLDRLLQREPDNGEAWALRGIAHSLLVIRNLDTSTRPLEAGRDAVDRAQRLAPGSPWVELARGMHFIAMISRGGDGQAPRPHIDRAVRVLPVCELTRYAEIASFWMAFDAERTERSARAWLEAEPKSLFPAWVMAQRAGLLRDFDETVRWANRAAGDGDVTGARALVTLFEAQYYLRADLPAARAALDRIGAAQRGVHRVVYCRWLLAMAENAHDRALQELAQTPETMLRDRAYHGPKALLGAFAHLAAGRATVAQEQFAVAEQMLRVELKNDPENEELRGVLAVTLASMGKREAAEAELAALEPLLRGRAPSAYTAQPIALIAQARGILGQDEALAFWLRRLLLEPSSLPLTAVSVRIDPRFGRFSGGAAVKALLEQAERPTSGAQSRQAPEDKSVAVLAFKNLSGDPAREFFSDGLSEAVADVLGRVPGLKVVGSASAFSFKGKAVPIPEIARQLGVSHVVEGTVLQEGQTVRITAKLTQADGFQVWVSDKLEREAKNIFALHDEVSGLIAKNLSLKLGFASAATPASVDPEAYQLYLAARQAFTLSTPEGLNRAEELLSRAIKLEPGLARAHAALSDVRRNQAQGAQTAGAFSQRNSAAMAGIVSSARQAVSLDPDLPEAHVALGAAHWMAWEIEEAKRALRKALALNPNCAAGHHLLARALMTDGRIDEALASFRRAVELDPLFSRIADNYSLALLNAGRPAEALVLADRALVLQPENKQAAGAKAAALAMLGRGPEAVALAQALEPDSKTAAWVAWVYALAGERATAERVLARPLVSVYTAAAFAALGRYDDCIAAIQSVASLAAYWAEFTYLVPSLDPIRQDSRFQKFLADSGAAEAHARAQAWRAANPPQRAADKK